MWPFRRKRGRELFRAYELKVIDALRAALPTEAAERYDRQIESLELVQRHFEDTDVTTYPDRSGPQFHDPAHAFANHSLELKIATLTLQGATGKGRVKVVAVDGHVFSYDFTPSPRKLGPRDSIVVTKTTLHVDPTQPDDGSSVAGRLHVTISWPLAHDPAAVRILGVEEARPGRVVIRTSESDGVALTVHRQYVLESSDGEWRVSSQKDLGFDVLPPSSGLASRLRGLLRRSDS